MRITLAFNELDFDWNLHFGQQFALNEKRDARHTFDSPLQDREKHPKAHLSCARAQLWCWSMLLRFLRRPWASEGGPALTRTERL